MAVREMAAVREIHAQNRVSVLNCRQVNAHVRLCAAVRLHVGVIGAEQFLRAIDRGLFDNVGILTAAIVAFPGIAFRVLVGKD